MIKQFESYLDNGYCVGRPYFVPKWVREQYAELMSPISSCHELSHGIDGLIQDDKANLYTIANLWADMSGGMHNLLNISNGSIVPKFRNNSGIDAFVKYFDCDVEFFTLALGTEVEEGNDLSQHAAHVCDWLHAEERSEPIRMNFCDWVKRGGGDIMKMAEHTSNSDVSQAGYIIAESFDKQGVVLGIEDVLSWIRDFKSNCVLR